MKISAKLEEDTENHHRSSSHLPAAPPLLLRAKLPVVIFNLPFLSQLSTTTTHPSDLSLSFSTNFSSGPSLKLTYVTAAASLPAPRLTLTMKSGTGLFGSPKNSPLVISANFSFNPSTQNPSFSLLFKPQLGSFSLRKSISSHLDSGVIREPANGNGGFESNSFDFERVETPGSGKDSSIGKDAKEFAFKGIELAARTQIPLARAAALNFRWTAKFVQGQLPFLRINKIGFQRIEEAPRDDDKLGKNAGAGELEVLKFMCCYMKRELDDLKGLNSEMKREFDKLKTKKHLQKPEASAGNPSNGLDQQKGVQIRGYRGSGNANEGKQEKRNGSLATDLEKELRKAASASASP